jgi:ABC-type transporter Mla maintaining outer membrane lipid asymmetry ATPase subunit MlaF
MAAFWRKKKDTGVPLMAGEVSFAISSLEFNDGKRLDLGANELVVFVGPNNVGKTATLRDVLQILRGRKGHIVLGLETRKSGDADAVVEWLEGRYTRDYSYPHWYKGWGAHVQFSDVKEGWKRANALGELTEFFCRLVGTEERLAASAPADNLDVLTEPCDKPLQGLVGNKAIEKQLSKATVEAFDITLFLDRWSGKKICIRSGEVPEGDPWTPSFLNEVRKQIPLQYQGDGIRSFAGCILEGVLAPHPVVLIDEPEAFLHPQHARILGRMLAATKATDRQLFIATHSLHLLLGLLDSVETVIRVVRVRRDGDTNPICELRDEQVKEVWKDPLLRASNVLEGVFHDKVVICEGDADCRFYSCVLDALIGAHTPVRRPDVMFTSCGGKARMPLVIRALKALDVTVNAVVDFDVMQNGKELREIVESYGSAWGDLEPQWKQVSGALSQVAPSLSLAEVRSRVSELLNRASGPYLDEKTRASLLDCLRTASPWAAAKRAGKSSLPSGGPTEAFMDLTGRLRKMGVFIVECGELERFVPSLGSHGPAWVNEALRKDLANDPELAPAREFVRDLAKIGPE